MKRESDAFGGHAVCAPASVSVVPATRAAPAAVAKGAASTATAQGPAAAALFAGAALAAMFAGAAFAALVGSADAQAGDGGTEERGERVDTVLFWGAGIGAPGTDSAESGANIGFVTALNGDIGRSGWTITSSVGLGQTKAPLNRTKSFYSSLLLGHQWTQPGYSFSLSAGLHHRNNRERPAGGPTDGGDTGVTVQYGFDTRAVDAFYLHSYGAWSTVADQVYFHLKVGRRTQRLRFGGEFTLSGDAWSRPALRTGVFVGDIALPGRVAMAVSAGYLRHLDPGKSGGFYATAGFSMPLRLR